MLRPPPSSTLFPYTTLFRSLADKLAAPWGQPVVVENKSGANTIVAADAVAKSSPDGHTILMTSDRSEEHTSELQSLTNLVCRLLLEKKKNTTKTQCTQTHTQ